MAVYSNTAEGGTNGTTVTTANSGGISGDAWNTVGISGSSTVIFSSTQKARGLLSYFFTVSAFAFASVVRIFTSVTATYASRFFCFVPSGTHISTIRLCIATDTTGTTTAFLRINWINNTNLIKIENATGAVVATSVNTYSRDTWYIISFAVTNATGVSSGNLTCNIYDSTGVLIETLSVSNNNFGTSNVSMLQYGYPQIFSPSSADTIGIYIDEIAENDTGILIGPPSTNISLSRIFKWNVKSSLSLSRIFVWNTRAVLSLNRVFKWNVRTAVTPLTRIFKWNVRAAVTPFTRIFKWNVIAGVLISRIFIWNTRQTITPVRIFKWNVRISVTPFTRQFVWNTRLQVSIARSFIWNVIFKLITSRIFVWNVRSILSTSRTFLWNDVGRIIIIRSLVWDVYAPWVANVKDCGPWTSINGNTVAWTPEQVNSTSWR